MMPFDVITNIRILALVVFFMVYLPYVYNYWFLKTTPRANWLYTPRQERRHKVLAFYLQGMGSFFAGSLVIVQVAFMVPFFLFLGYLAVGDAFVRERCSEFDNDKDHLDGLF